MMILKPKEATAVGSRLEARLVHGPAILNTDGRNSGANYFDGGTVCAVTYHAQGPQKTCKIITETSEHSHQSIPFAYSKGPGRKNPLKAQKLPRSCLERWVRPEQKVPFRVDTAQHARTAHHMPAYMQRAVDEVWATFQIIAQTSTKIFERP